MATQWIAKCGKGHAVRGGTEAVSGGWLTCRCGGAGVARPIKVVLNDRKCGSVCQGATGPACSCSCGGENHGGQKVF